MKIVEVSAVSKRFGDVVAVDDIGFEVGQAEIISLLGPSGCGKTTTLRLIAGFEAPDSGRISIAGQDMQGRRPYERNVGLLFQDYALFPHMTVEQNVAYGLRHRGFNRSAIPRRTGEMLELVKLSGLEKRRPAQLSGGQQQRVALARALATEPEVMLLDEPLSALDAKLRQELRVELKEILNAVGSTTIVVTHDQEEAMSLAERVIVMDQGRFYKDATPTEIYTHPANKFVAEFIGRSNWFSGRLEAEVVPKVHRFARPDGPELLVPAPADPSAASYEVCVRPERIAVATATDTTGGEADGPMNVLHGVVADSAFLGADLHMFIELSHGHRIAVIKKNLGERVESSGERVTLRFAPADCIVVPAEG